MIEVIVLIVFITLACAFCLLVITFAAWVISFLIGEITEEWKVIQRKCRYWSLIWIVLNSIY